VRMLVVALFQRGASCIVREGSFYFAGLACYVGDVLGAAAHG
jgi:hypothetical protein